MITKEQKRLYDKEYYEKNKTKHLALAKIYRDTHPEQFRRQKKKYYIANKEKITKQSSSYYYANRDNRIKKCAINRRQRLYGVTPEMFDEMFRQQNNSCAICGTNQPGGRSNWHIDHCHKTNIVRGLLCRNCNWLLGHAKDNPAILTAAAVYLNLNHAYPVVTHKR